MTPARRRRSCSCANTATRFSAKPRLRSQRYRCWRRSRAFSPPTRAAPRKARRSNNSRRPSRSGLRRAPPPPSPPTGCSSLQPHRTAGHPRRAGRRPRSRSTSSPRCAAALLDHLFPSVAVTRFDAAQIDDHLDAAIAPSVVLINPPFSVMANVERRMADAAYSPRCLRACAAARWRPARRDHRCELCARRSTLARRLRSVAGTWPARLLGGDRWCGLCPKHGTTIDTRLLVIDKAPAVDARAFPASLAMAPDAETLLSWVIKRVPPRLPVEAGRTPRTDVRLRIPRPSGEPDRAFSRDIPYLRLLLSELAYDTIDWRRPRARRLTDAIYEGYTARSRSGFPVRSPIRPCSSNRPRWRRSRRPNRPTGRCCRRTASSRRAAVGRPARNRDLCRRSPCRLPRRLLDGRRHLRCRRRRAR